MMNCGSARRSQGSAIQRAAEENLNFGSAFWIARWRSLPFAKTALNAV
jgi:hypothetical protein